MGAKPVPEDHPQITPYLAVNGVGRLIDFLKQVFGACELGSTTMPDGRIADAVSLHWRLQGYGGGADRQVEELSAEELTQREEQFVKKMAPKNPGV